MRTPSSLLRALLLSSLSLAVSCGGAVASDEVAKSGEAGEANDGNDANEASSLEQGLSTLPSGAIPYRGVNLNGADFGSALPGRQGIDYVFPNAGEVDYFLSKGMNTFRIGFMWERLQRTAKGNFDVAYLANVDALVRTITSKGGYALLNPQNFARYYGKVVGSAAVPKEVFADFWRRLALQYKSNSRVLFGLVNEPNNMPTEQWVGAANAAIAAIRLAGAPNVVLVPGNGWTGAYSWNSNWYGTPNAVAMLSIKDPSDNMMFEVHQYLDGDSSGGSTTCVSSTIGRQRLTSFVSWLRANKKRGFIGELAGASNATCNAAVKDMLSYVSGQSDVIVGWTWWSAGPWWPASYRFSLEPQKGVDRPQMALLAPFLFRK